MNDKTLQTFSDDQTNEDIRARVILFIHNFFHFFEIPHFAAREYLDGLTTTLYDLFDYEQTAEDTREEKEKNLDALNIDSILSDLDVMQQRMLRSAGFFDSLREELGG